MHPRVILNRLENHRIGQKKRIYNRTLYFSVTYTRILFAPRVYLRAN